MGLFTYKQWKMINESNFGLFNLGITSHNSVLNAVETTDTEVDAEIENIQTLEEAKKKMYSMKKNMKKKMLSDEDLDAPEDEKPEGEITDEKPEEDKECSCKDKEEGDEEDDALMMKKKCTKKMAKEEADFWSSLSKQLDFTPYKEDALIMDEEPNLSHYGLIPDGTENS